MYRPATEFNGFRRKTARIPGLIALAFMLVWPACVPAADAPWFDHALRLGGGHMNARLERAAAEEYGSVAMDEGRTAFVGVTLRATRWNEFELGLSRSGADGIQTGESWPTGGVNSVDIESLERTLWLTWRFRLVPAGALVAPWVGCGLHIGSVKTLETESALTAEGLVAETTARTTDTIYGIHPTAGFDLYPRGDSSFAVSVEAMRMFTRVGGDSRYHAGGTLVIVGIRWNFWQGG